MKTGSKLQNRFSTHTNSTDKTIGVQIWEIVQVLVEVIVLQIRIHLCVLETFYRKFFPEEPAPLKGKIVLITGAGHGIGRELALIYAAEGSTVVAWDINKENNENTVQEISKLGYPKAHAYALDVGNREAVLKAAKEVQKDVGDVNILINNAGIMPTHSLEDHTPEEIKKIFDINVFAHFWTIEAFLPSMKRRNYGHVVGLSSMAGLCGFPNLVPYCGSKFAVRGIMEALHVELRAYDPNCRVKFTTIMPTMTNTGLCKKPNIRFPKITPMLSTSQTASAIMKAQQSGAVEASVPNYFMPATNSVRLLPHKCGLYIMDFLGCNLDSDLHQ